MGKGDRIPYILLNPDRKMFPAGTGRKSLAFPLFGSIRGSGGPQCTAGGAAVSVIPSLLRG